MPKTKRQTKLKLARFPVRQQPQKPWTVIEMLEEILDGVKTGKINPAAMMVFYTEPTGDGNFRPCYFTKNVSVPDQIAFGQLMTAMALQEWKQT